MSARVTGFIVGLAVALGFAVLISLLPASWFLDTPKRVAVYVVCALAAPPTVWLLQWIARLRNLEQRRTFFWAIAGAMSFDSLAIGFAPSLYGQSGQALAWTASALIFAFATAVMAGLVILRD
ncbi:MAG: hypothetical protein WCH82_14885 [Mycobacteriaceae bacterium]|jgi:hypothetical protein